MNKTVTISLSFLSLLILTLFFIPTFAHAATPEPSSYFSDPAVSEVGELWNKNCEVLHFVYYNDGRGITWDIVGTCPYYPYSPEHTVYDVSYYPDGSQSVRVDHRDTGVVDATPPSQEAFEQALEKAEAELGHPIENVHQLDEAYQTLHNQAAGAESNPDSPSEPTSQTTPEPAPESTPQPLTYELIIEYDSTQGIVEGAGIYEENTKVNLISEPKEEYEIDYWTGLDNDTYVLMTKNKVVEVFFKPVKPSPSVEPTVETVIEPISETTTPTVVENDAETSEQSTQETTTLSNSRQIIMIVSIILLISSSLLLYHFYQKKKQ